MNDWRNQVRRKLARARFSAAERAEISRELADHLDDLYESLRRDGLDDSAARARAFAELHEDPRLGLHLRRARKENPMNLNERTKCLWLPGIAMIVASGAVLQILKRAIYSEYFAHVHIAPGYAGSHNWILTRVLAYREASLLVYVFWLFLLPFLGAAGAWWARRAGSGRTLQLATGFFPLILFVTVLAGVLGGEATFPFDFTYVFLPPRVFPMIGGFSDLLLSWMVIPGAALFLGVLPFLCKRDGQQGTVAAN